mmetsp:Transcript_45664/g.97533  ORF Transcript_45664/g.97533 Transcript_45664/m.97533 type:complete len:242 (-) Transcript_45664:1328-2053(-)
MLRFFKLGRRHRQRPIIIGHRHEGTLVASSVHIVWCTENCVQLRVILLPTKLFDFMRANDIFQIVLPAKAFSHVRAEHEDTLRLTVGRPITWSAARIRPHQIDDNALVRHRTRLHACNCLIRCCLVGPRLQLCLAVHCSNLCQGQSAHVNRKRIRWVMAHSWHIEPRVWPRKSAMAAKYLLVDEMAQRQFAEGLRKQIEEVLIIFLHALASETVDQICFDELMVPTIEENCCGIFHFHCVQ